MIRWAFDTIADALYVHLTTAPVDDTAELGPGLVVDLSADGVLRGVEVIGVSAFDLRTLQALPDDVAEQVAGVVVSSRSSRTAIAGESVLSNYLRFEVMAQDAVLHVAAGEVSAAESHLVTV